VFSVTIRDAHKVHCRGINTGADHKYSVERFEFNAKQGMVKDAGKDFCGEPPKSYYK
jgi:hypothetical protein